MVKSLEKRLLRSPKNSVTFDEIKFRLGIPKHPLKAVTTTSNRLLDILFNQTPNLAILFPTTYLIIYSISTFFSKAIIWVIRHG